MEAGAGVGRLLRGEDEAVMTASAWLPSRPPVGEGLFRQTIE